MEKSTIVFCGIDNDDKKFFNGRLKQNKLLFLNENITAENITRLKNKLRDCGILVITIYSKLDARVLSKLPKLRFVTTMSTGYDHINVEDCLKRGIIVSNVPSFCEDSVAEHTISLMLTFSRKILEATARTRKDDFSLEGLMGFELKGKTLGVIGVGRIGQKVIELAKAFEMKIIAYDPIKRRELERRLGFRYVDLTKLLRSADIISIHAPLNKNTFHLINRKNVRSIKKGAYLINTARGAIVETKALADALNKEILAGAGLDVLESEPYVKKPALLRSKLVTEQDVKNVKEERILLKNKNVIASPHSAYYSRESVEKRLSVILENIQRFIAGRPMNVVETM